MRTAGNMLMTSFTALFGRWRVVAALAAACVLSATGPLTAEDGQADPDVAGYRTHASSALFSNDRFSLAPTYYLMGVPNTKFQLGFIYRFSASLPLFLGYSQLIIWDLDKYSSPMRDINCHPDFYYKYEVNWGVIRTIDLGIWEHTSNLRGGSDSRGWDRSYIEMNTYASFWKFGLMANMKFYVLYRLDRYSRRLDEYMGFWELNASLAFFEDLYLFDKIELTLRLFAGGKYSYTFARGGQEIGLTFKISGNPANIYLQYYHGYCEYMLHYDRRHVAFRYGFLFYL